MSASGKIVAIIPARGGSERVSGKNLLPLAGVPLVVHSIRQALAAERVDIVYVSTDDAEIARTAEAAGARVVLRPAALSTASASSESALLHVLDHRVAEGQDDPDLVLFLQCTSPVRSAGDIDRAIETLVNARADSLFSATENSRFIWELEGDELRPFNYDFQRRPREQDMSRQFQENGSIYVFKPWVLRRNGNRLGGRMTVYEMDYWSSFQLDTPEHAELLEWILSRR